MSDDVDFEQQQSPGSPVADSPTPAEVVQATVASEHQNQQMDCDGDLMLPEGARRAVDG